MQPLKILALIGSPRNEESWTYKNIRLVEDKMNAIQPTTVEYIFQQKVALPFCDGCLHCVSVGEHDCPSFGKVGPIAQKMDEADGLILGAPVHTFNVTGLMKNFVEYFMYKRNRPSFFGKKAVVFATASGGGHKVVLDFLEGTAQAWGCDVVSRLGVSSSQMQKPAYIEMLNECAEDVAQKFVASIQAGGLGSPNFNQLMNFRAMQNMTRNQPKSKNYAYWEERDWLEAEFYTDAPVPVLARIAAGYIATRMRKSIRKGNVKPIR
jgi:multimeric flavodoxin WrbA